MFNYFGRKEAPQSNEPSIYIARLKFTNSYRVGLRSPQELGDTQYPEFADALRAYSDRIPTGAIAMVLDVPEKSIRIITRKSKSVFEVTTISNKKETTETLTL